MTLTFAENCVRALARAAARELADRVTVTLRESSSDFTVRCGGRMAIAKYEAQPDEQARQLERAVETVLGLREPEPA